MRYLLFLILIFNLSYANCKYFLQKLGRWDYTYNKDVDTSKASFSAYSTKYKTSGESNGVKLGTALFKDYSTSTSLIYCEIGGGTNLPYDRFIENGYTYGYNPVQPYIQVIKTANSGKVLSISSNHPNGESSNTNYNKDGSTSGIFYDENGNMHMKIETSTDGSSIKTGYDADGNKLASLIKNDNGSMIFDYDENGKIKELSSYDKNGELTSKLDIDLSNNSSQDVGYDSDGNMATFDEVYTDGTSSDLLLGTDGSYSKTNYDSNDVKTSVINNNSDGTYNEIEYDSNGNETSKTELNADGSTTQTTYNTTSSGSASDTPTDYSKVIKTSPDGTQTTEIKKDMSNYCDDGAPKKNGHCDRNCADVGYFQNLNGTCSEPSNNDDTPPNEDNTNEDNTPNEDNSNDTTTNDENTNDSDSNSNSNADNSDDSNNSDNSGSESSNNSNNDTSENSSDDDTLSDAPAPSGGTGGNSLTDNLKDLGADTKDNTEALNQNTLAILNDTKQQKSLTEKISDLVDLLSNPDTTITSLAESGLNEVIDKYLNVDLGVSLNQCSSIEPIGFTLSDGSKHEILNQNFLDSLPMDLIRTMMLFSFTLSAVVMALKQS